VANGIRITYNNSLAIDGRDALARINFDCDNTRFTDNSTTAGNEISGNIFTGRYVFYFKNIDKNTSLTARKSTNSFGDTISRTVWNDKMEKLEEYLHLVYQYDKFNVQLFSDVTLGSILNDNFDLYLANLKLNSSNLFNGTRDSIFDIYSIWGNYPNLRVEKASIKENGFWRDAIIIRYEETKTIANRLDINAYGQGDSLGLTGNASARFNLEVNHVFDFSIMVYDSNTPGNEKIENFVINELSATAQTSSPQKEIDLRSETGNFNVGTLDAKLADNSKIDINLSLDVIYNREALREYWEIIELSNEERIRDNALEESISRIESLNGKLKATLEFDTIIKDWLSTDVAASTVTLGNNSINIFECKDYVPIVDISSDILNTFRSMNNETIVNTLTQYSSWLENLVDTHRYDANLPLSDAAFGELVDLSESLKSAIMDRVKINTVTTEAISLTETNIDIDSASGFIVGGQITVKDSDGNSELMEIKSISSNTLTVERTHALNFANGAAVVLENSYNFDSLEDLNTLLSSDLAKTTGPVDSNQTVFGVTSGSGFNVGDQIKVKDGNDNFELMEITAISVNDLTVNRTAQNPLSFMTGATVMLKDAYDTNLNLAYDTATKLLTLNFKVNDELQRFIAPLAKEAAIGEVYDIEVYNTKLTAKNKFIAEGGTFKGQDGNQTVVDYSTDKDGDGDAGNDTSSFTIQINGLDFTTIVLNDETLADKTNINDMLLYINSVFASTGVGDEGKHVSDYIIVVIEDTDTLCLQKADTDSSINILFTDKNIQYLGFVSGENSYIQGDINVDLDITYEYDLNTTDFLAGIRAEQKEITYEADTGGDLYFSVKYNGDDAVDYKINPASTSIETLVINLNAQRASLSQENKIEFINDGNTISIRQLIPDEEVKIGGWINAAIEENSQLEFNVKDNASDASNNRIEILEDLKVTIEYDSHLNQNNDLTYNKTLLAGKYTEVQITAFLNAMAAEMTAASTVVEFKFDDYDASTGKMNFFIEHDSGVADIRFGTGKTWQAKDNILSESTGDREKDRVNDGHKYYEVGLNQNSFDKKINYTISEDIDIDITIGGVTATITLGQGSYTDDEVVKALNDLIAAKPALVDKVEFEIRNDALKLNVSKQSIKTLEIGGNAGISELGFKDGQKSRIYGIHLIAENATKELDYNIKKELDFSILVNTNQYDFTLEWKDYENRDNLLTALNTLLAGEAGCDKIRFIQELGYIRLAAFDTDMKDTLLMISAADAKALNNHLGFENGINTYAKLIATPQLQENSRVDSRFQNLTWDAERVKAKYKIFDFSTTNGVLGYVGNGDISSLIETDTYSDELGFSGDQIDDQIKEYAASTNSFFTGEIKGDIIATSPDPDQFRFTFQKDDLFKQNDSAIAELGLQNGQDSEYIFLIENAPALTDYSLKEDASFNLEIDSSGGVSFTVLAADTATNSSVQDMIDDINASINASSLNGKVEAKSRYDDVFFELLEGQGSKLTLSGTNDGAKTGLGLYDAETLNILEIPIIIENRTDFRVAGNIQFDLKAGADAAKTIIIYEDVLKDNHSNDSFISDINQALETAGFTGVMASFQGSAILFKDKENRKLTLSNANSHAQDSIGFKAGTQASDKMIITDGMNPLKGDARKGVLIDDAKFDIAGKTVSVLKTDTSNNNGLDDLLSDVKTAVTSAGLDAQISVLSVNDKLVFVSKDGSDLTTTSREAYDVTFVDETSNSNLKAFENFETKDIRSAIGNIADLLQEASENDDTLNKLIPLLGCNLDSLNTYRASLNSLKNEIERNASTSFTDTINFINDYLGNEITIDFTFTGDTITAQLIVQKQGSYNFKPSFSPAALAELDSTPPEGMDNRAVVISTRDKTSFTINSTATLTLDIEFDYSADEVEITLKDTSNLSTIFKVDQTGINAEVLVGATKASLVDGKIIFTSDGTTGGGNVEYRIEFDRDIALDGESIDSNDYTATLTGKGTIDLPLYDEFLEESLGGDSLQFNLKNLQDVLNEVPDSVEIIGTPPNLNDVGVAPVLAEDKTGVDALLLDPEVIINGLDSMLAQIIANVASPFTNLGSIPLIGGKVMDVVDPVIEELTNIRSTIRNYLETRYDDAKTALGDGADAADTMQWILHDVFGKVLGLLKDVGIDYDGVVGENDIYLTRFQYGRMDGSEDTKFFKIGCQYNTSSNTPMYTYTELDATSKLYDNPAVQYDFKLAKSFYFELPAEFSFGVGVPGIGLDLNSEKVVVKVDMELRTGFGVSQGDIFYIHSDQYDTVDGQGWGAPEFTLDGSITMRGVNGEFELGMMGAEFSDGIDGAPSVTTKNKIQINHFQNGSDSTTYADWKAMTDAEKEDSDFDNWLQYLNDDSVSHGFTIKSYAEDGSVLQEATFTHPGTDYDSGAEGAISLLAHMFADMMPDYSVVPDFDSVVETSGANVGPIGARIQFLSRNPDTATIEVTDATGWFEEFMFDVGMPEDTRSMDLGFNGAENDDDQILIHAVGNSITDQRIPPVKLYNDTYLQIFLEDGTRIPIEYDWRAYGHRFYTDKIAGINYDDTDISSNAKNRKLTVQGTDDTDNYNYFNISDGQVVANGIRITYNNSLAIDGRDALARINFDCDNTRFTDNSTTAGNEISGNIFTGRYVFYFKNIDKNTSLTARKSTNSFGDTISRTVWNDKMEKLEEYLHLVYQYDKFNVQLFSDVTLGSILNDNFDLYLANLKLNSSNLFNGTRDSIFDIYSIWGNYPNLRVEKASIKENGFWRDAIIIRYEETKTIANRLDINAYGQGDSLGLTGNASARFNLEVNHVFDFSIMVYDSNTPGNEKIENFVINELSATAQTSSPQKEIDLRSETGNFNVGTLDAKLADNSKIDINLSLDVIYNREALREYWEIIELSNEERIRDNALEESISRIESLNGKLKATLEFDTIIKDWLSTDVAASTVTLGNNSINIFECKDYVPIVDISSDILNTFRSMNNETIVNTLTQYSSWLENLVDTHRYDANLPLSDAAFGELVDLSESLKSAIMDRVKINTVTTEAISLTETNIDIDSASGFIVGGQITVKDSDGNSELMEIKSISSNTLTVERTHALNFANGAAVVLENSYNFDSLEDLNTLLSSDLAKTTGPVDSNQTVFGVTSGSGFNVGDQIKVKDGNDNFELMEITAISVNDLTVNRTAQNPLSFMTGATVMLKDAYDTNLNLAYDTATKLLTLNFKVNDELQRFIAPLAKEAAIGEVYDIEVYNTKLTAKNKFIAEGGTFKGQDGNQTVVDYSTDKDGDGDAGNDTSSFTIQINGLDFTTIVLNDETLADKTNINDMLLYINSVFASTGVGDEGKHVSDYIIVVIEDTDTLCLQKADTDSSINILFTDKNIQYLGFVSGENSYIQGDINVDLDITYEYDLNTTDFLAGIRAEQKEITYEADTGGDLYFSVKYNGDDAVDYKINPASTSIETLVINLNAQRASLSQENKIEFINDGNTISIRQLIPDEEVKIGGWINAAIEENSQLEFNVKDNASDASNNRIEILEDLKVTIEYDSHLNQNNDLTYNKTLLAGKYTEVQITAFLNAMAAEMTAASTVVEFKFDDYDASTGKMNFFIEHDSGVADIRFGTGKTWQAKDNILSESTGDREKDRVNDGHKYYEVGLNQNSFDKKINYTISEDIDIDITIGGVTATITLGQGSYTDDEVVKALNDLIAAKPALVDKVEFEIRNDALKLNVSKQSIKTLEIGGNAGISELGFKDGQKSRIYGIHLIAENATKELDYNIKKELDFSILVNTNQYDFTLEWKDYENRDNLLTALNTLLAGEAGCDKIRFIQELGYIRLAAFDTDMKDTLLMISAADAKALNNHLGFENGINTYAKLIATPQLQENSRVDSRFQNLTWDAERVKAKYKIFDFSTTNGVLGYVGNGDISSLIETDTYSDELGFSGDQIDDQIKEYAASTNSFFTGEIKGDIIATSPDPDQFRFTFQKDDLFKQNDSAIAELGLQNGQDSEYIFLIENAPALTDYSLKEDASFNLEIDSSGGVSFTVLAADTATNSSVQDMIDDINASINASSLNGKVEAKSRYDDVFFELLEGQGSKLTLSGTNDGAKTGLGLYDAETLNILEIPIIIENRTDFRVAGNIQFDLKAGADAAKTIIIYEDVLKDNHSNDSFISDINQALETAGFTGVMASFQGSAILFKDKENRKLTLSNANSHAQDSIGFKAGTQASDKMIITDGMNPLKGDARKGVLIDDAKFDIAGKTVSVLKTDTSNNNGLDDLLSDVKTAVTSAGLDAQISVLSVNDKLVFVSKDGSDLTTTSREAYDVTFVDETSNSNLKAFENFETKDIRSAIGNIADLLQEASENDDTLNKLIPLLGCNLDSLNTYRASLNSLKNEIERNASTSFTDTINFINDYLGNEITIDFTFTGDTITAQLIVQKQGSYNFKPSFSPAALAELDSTPPEGMDNRAVVISTRDKTSFTINSTATLTLDIEFDYSADEVEITLKDTSNLSTIFKVDQTGINAEVLVGATKASLVDGKIIFTSDGTTGGGNVEYRIEFDRDIALDGESIDSNDYTATLTGKGTIDLPLYDEFLEESLGGDSLQFNLKNLQDVLNEVPDSVEIIGTPPNLNDVGVAPVLAEDKTGVDALLLDPEVIINGLDSMLAQIIANVASPFTNLGSIPLIGGKVMDVVDPVIEELTNIRSTIRNYLETRYDDAKTALGDGADAADTMQWILHDVFGKVLGLLKDVGIDYDGVVGENDIYLTRFQYGRMDGSEDTKFFKIGCQYNTSSNTPMYTYTELDATSKLYDNPAVQYDFKLAKSFYFELPAEFSFGVGVPGIGLDLNSEKVVVKVDMELRTGFGVSQGDIFYIHSDQYDTVDGQGWGAPEFTLDGSITMRGVNGEFELGMMGAEFSDGIDGAPSVTTKNKIQINHFQNGSDSTTYADWKAMTDAEKEDSDFDNWLQYLNDDSVSHGFTIKSYAEDGSVLQEATFTHPGTDYDSGAEGAISLLAHMFADMMPDYSVVPDFDSVVETSGANVGPIGARIQFLSRNPDTATIEVTDATGWFEEFMFDVGMPEDTRSMDLGFNGAENDDDQILIHAVGNSITDQRIPPVKLYNDTYLQIFLEDGTRIPIEYDWRAYGTNGTYHHETGEFIPDGIDAFVEQMNKALIASLEIWGKDTDIAHFEKTGDGKLKLVGTRSGGDALDYLEIDRRQRTGAYIDADVNFRDLMASDGDLIVTDGRITLNELFSGIVEIEANLEVRAEANFKVETNSGLIDDLFAAIDMDGFKILPTVKFELHTEAFAKVGGSLRNGGFKTEADWNGLEFHNVQVDIGNVLSEIVKPVVDRIMFFLKPITNVIGDGIDGASAFLNAEIPILSELHGLIDDIPDSLLGFTGDGKDTINALLDMLGKLVKMAGRIDEILSEDDDGKIFVNLGSWVITKETAPFPIPLEIMTYIDGGKDVASSNPIALLQGLGITDGQEVSIKPPIGMGFLSPMNIFKMLQGETFEIFGVHLPEIKLKLGIDLGFDFKILEFGIGGGIELEMKKLGFGYDSYGLEQVIASIKQGAVPNPLDMFDGFYVANTPGEEFSIHAYFYGRGGVDLLLASAEAKLQMDIDVGVDILDPNEDGHLRLDEIVTVIGDNPINILRLFDIRAGISMDAYAEIDIVGFSWELDLGFDLDFSLHDLLGFEQSDLDDRGILGEIVGDTLRINAGMFAKERIYGDSDDSSGSEVTIWEDGGDIVVTIGSTTKRYSKSGVKKIIFRGGDGNDKVDASGINGIICDFSGGLGNDTLIGGNANDIILGGLGNDTLKGGGGADTLKGNEGNDTLEGGEGDDVFIGGAGDDNFNGGGGADRFLYGTSFSEYGGKWGNDTITETDDASQTFTNKRFFTVEDINEGSVIFKIENHGYKIGESLNATITGVAGFSELNKEWTLKVIDKDTLAIEQDIFEDTWEETFSSGYLMIDDDLSKRVNPELEPHSELLKYGDTIDFTNSDLGTDLIFTIDSITLIKTDSIFGSSDTITVKGMGIETYVGGKADNTYEVKATGSTFTRLQGVSGEDNYTIYDNPEITSNILIDDDGNNYAKDHLVIDGGKTVDNILGMTDQKIRLTTGAYVVYAPETYPNAKLGLNLVTFNLHHGDDILNVESVARKTNVYINTYSGSDTVNFGVAHDALATIEQNEKQNMNHIGGDLQRVWVNMGYISYGEDPDNFDHLNLYDTTETGDDEVELTNDHITSTVRIDINICFTGNGLNI